MNAVDIELLAARRLEGHLATPDDDEPARVPLLRRLAAVRAITRRATRREVRAAAAARTR